MQLLTTVCPLTYNANHMLQFVWCSHYGFHIFDSRRRWCSALFWFWYSFTLSDCWRLCTVVNCFVVVVSRRCRCVLMCVCLWFDNNSKNFLRLVQMSHYIVLPCCALCVSHTLTECTANKETKKKTTQNGVSNILV